MMGSFKLAFCYYALLAAARTVHACEERCGRNKDRRFTLLKRYTMCHLDTQKEVCSMFRRRNLRRGFACGPCSLSDNTPPEDGQVENLNYRETTLLQLKVSEPDALVTLWVVADRGTRIPVARSYQGHAWEAYGGRFASLQFTCADSDKMCSTRIPAMPRANKVRLGKYKYQLATFQHAPDRDYAVARFLEQASFGPTRETIDAFPQHEADWMQEQMTSVPLSSHRQKFRHYWNHRFEMPSFQGISTHACHAGTYYRKYAFVRKDDEKMVQLELDSLNRTVLSIDGQRRTVVNETMYASKPENNDIYGEGFHELCGTIGELIGGSFKLYHTPTKKCQHVYNQAGDKMGIPPVFFDETTPPTDPVVELDGYAVEFNPEFFENSISQELLVETDLPENHCPERIPEVTGKPAMTIYGMYKGEYWIHDPRFQVYDNTIDAPKPDGGGAIVALTENTTVEEYQTQCFSAAVNFVNQDGCFLSNDPNGCGEAISDNTAVNLTLANFRRVYDATDQQKFIYAVTGLRQNETNEEPPCAPGVSSRWVLVDESECVDSTLDSKTITAFADLLGASADTNQYVRNILFPSIGVSCHANDENLFGFAVTVGEDCWQNVHHSHLQVYDFTQWVTNHPGGQAAIKEFAESGSFVLDYRTDHPMTRWQENVDTNLIDLGRLGDEVSLTASSKAAEAFASITKSDRIAGSTVVCGSPNEVSNRLEEGGTLNHGAFDAVTYYNQTSSAWDMKRQRGEIWMDIALNGDDQLRQKVAWALSQIVVVSPGSIGTWYATEKFTAYYDIFVRHAFGNYRDILKEVSFSPIMAEMLSFLNSQSTAYIWQHRKRLEYADENYAREIMQLFSIGLTMLNIDGSNVLDENGNTILAYTNDDITEYARLWTGFQEQRKRGNVEDMSSSGNSIDPMKINAEIRDNLPKMGLRGQYVGDFKPLCSDLPDKHFLKEGATYRLLGSLPKAQFLSEPNEWATDDEILRVRLPESSELYNTLCNKGSGTDCQYQAKVVLDNHLVCKGIECEVTDPRIVEVEPGLFYEYVRRPCVYQAFYDNPRSMVAHWYSYFCGDPRLDIGAVTCCTEADKWGSSPQELFTGERVPYSNAKDRCEAKGMTLCNRPVWDCEDCDRNLGRWGAPSCYLYVKINLEGKIGVVHNVTDTRIKVKNIRPSVREDTKTFFRAHWSTSIQDALLSNYEENCAKLGCRRDSYDNLCLCPVQVSEDQVFTKDEPPSREQVLNDLHIGAFPPSAHDASFSSKDLGDGVRMHSLDGQFSTETIFEVTDDFGLKQFRKNIQSVVNLQTTNQATLSFRNPPHHISITNPEPRDAYYETEAGLDQYFFHPNTAPFLAIRFAQRFGISNPSPRYVKTIATAFRSGTYTDSVTGNSFGSGRYGDVGAMVAAVLLDRESRSIILDKDPAHGSVLEPFLKVVRVMRSLGFENDEDMRFRTFEADLQSSIGQQPHELPNVFSFFLPEYSPAGPVGDAELVCPECLTMTGPKSIALINGLFSLLKYGLDDAYDGFGFGRGSWEGYRRVAQFDYATGAVQYTPDSGASTVDIVNELALLLTSGRLAPAKRTKLVGVYDEAIRQGSAQEALITIQQLLLTTPEFHTNAISDNSGEVLPEEEPDTRSTKPYKAVIYVMLDGGMDSFNLLVPHTCQRGNEAGDLVDEQYRSERGNLALTNSERSQIINADAASDQPCSQFAIHPSMRILKELYDQEDLVFMANTGVIGESGMSKEDYRQKTRVQLFAHNAMQKESKTVDPWASAPGTGVLGRLATVLKKKKFKTHSISIDNPSIAVEPEAGAESPVPMIVSRWGVSRFDRKPDGETYDMKTPTDILNADGMATSNIFAKTWSKKLARGIREAETLKAALDDAELGSHWEENGISGTDRGFQTIAKLIQTRDKRESERDFFYVNNGGWDHHANMKTNLANKFTDLNAGLTDLVTELKRQLVWDDCVIVVTSEFSRTINQNSGAGSDHAWGGHYFMMGGDVKGGKIIGKYPDDITPTGELNIGRGRMIPTTSWDSIWNGVGQWMGAEDESDLDYCLPNRQKARGNGFNDLQPKEDLFRNSRRNLRRR